MPKKNNPDAKEDRSIKKNNIPDDPLQLNVQRKNEIKKIIYTLRNSEINEDVKENLLEKLKSIQDEIFQEYKKSGGIIHECDKKILEMTYDHEKDNFQYTPLKANPKWDRVIVISNTAMENRSPPNLPLQMALEKMYVGTRKMSPTSFEEEIRNIHHDGQMNLVEKLVDMSDRKAMITRLKKDGCSSCVKKSIRALYYMLAQSLVMNLEIIHSEVKKKMTRQHKQIEVIKILQNVSEMIKFKIQEFNDNNEKWTKDMVIQSLIDLYDLQVDLINDIIFMLH